VQDLIRERGADVARLLGDEETYIYVCGLKGMEAGVDEAFRTVCLSHGLDWGALLPTLRAAGRYHIETY
jgi:benzoyl-CoA 2,3-dioxygenase component A